MKEIHKIAALVIKDDTFLMVRKVGQEIWTSLGGKPEAGETETQALLREIKEEFDCDAVIGRKVGDFIAKAAHHDAMVKISAYLTELKGPITLKDSELAEYRFLEKDYRSTGVKLPDSMELQIIPLLISEGQLNW